MGGAMLRFLLLTLVSASQAFPSNVSSDPSHFYISFHDGKDQPAVERYSMDGSDDRSGTSVLMGFDLQEVRHMVNWKDGKLLVARTCKSDDGECSRVLIYGACNLLGKRAYEGDFTKFDKTSNPGLVHPYSIAVEPTTGYVFVSSQHSNTVIRYDANGSPLSYNSNSNASSM